MKKHLHHIIPKSAGGSDEPENLVELDPYFHALVHAHMYLNGGVQFDFRMQEFQLFDQSLQTKLKGKQAEAMKTLNNTDVRFQEGQKRGQQLATEARKRAVVLILPDGSEETFESCTDACNKYNLNKGEFSKMCRGKIRHVKGYRARFALY